MVKVTRADRDAAWETRPECYRREDNVTKPAWDGGVYDSMYHIQSYARHRLAALADDQVTDAVSRAAIIRYHQEPPFAGESMNYAMQAAIRAALAVMRGEG